MSSKAKRRVASERSRPSTFFIVAIIVALLIIVAAFVSYVAQTPGARPPKTKTSIATAAAPA